MLRSRQVTAQRLLLTAALALGLGATGCSDRACIKWGTTEGTCPSAVEARPFFGGCSNVESIDSAPEFVAGNLCCYDVTHSLDGLPCKPTDPQRNHAGGSAGSVSPPSNGTSVEVSTGIGGGGGVTSQGGGGANGDGGSGPIVCDSLKCGFAPDEPLAGCLSCAETMICATQSNACEESTDCLGFENCLSGCSINDKQCIAVCKAMFPDGAPIFEMFLQCAVCDVCKGSCASSSVRSLVACGLGGP